MPACQLILIEGVPGSGMTTLASAVRDLLAADGVPTRLVLEGDPEHPADFEMVAHYPRSAFNDLLTRHPEAGAALTTHGEIIGDDCFVPYRRIALTDGRALPDELFAELAAHDVYETQSPATYCRLALERWARFAEAARVAPEVVILESCFLQNPLTVLLAKHNVEPAFATEHLKRLAAAVAPLMPLLVYLWQTDTRATLEQVARERPTEWLDYVIGYVTGQAWGRATGARGFDGMVAFYEMRKALELQTLPELGIAGLAVENADKSAGLTAVAEYLAERGR